MQPDLDSSADLALGIAVYGAPPRATPAWRIQWLWAGLCQFMGSECCSVCCVHQNDSWSFQRCWQGEPRKWSEWMKNVILYHRCFQSTWISLLPHVVITAVGLHFAIRGSFKGSSWNTVKLLKVVRVPVVFLALSLTCSGACHAEQLWSIYPPLHSVTSTSQQHEGKRYENFQFLLCGTEVVVHMDLLSVVMERYRRDLSSPTSLSLCWHHFCSQ